MQHYYDDVTDANGNAQAGVSVLVLQNGVPASIFEADGVTPKANPLTTDEKGGYSFSAANGTYDFRVTSRSGAVTIRTEAATLFDGLDLAASGGAALVGFVQAGTGAVARSAQAKMRDTVSVKDFGAVGDGVTDDTAAVHAGLTYAEANSRSLYFPGGTYRVTSGFTNANAISFVSMHGDSRRGSSKILLDSASGTRFFYDSTGVTTFYMSVRDLEFGCAQFVTDTDLFRFSNAGTGNVRFRDTYFIDVDRPLVFKAGFYAQTCDFNNVHFINSGTIHSDSNVGFRGNIITLTNVHHDGTTPAMTSKVLMDLQGWRGIVATNLMLEGSLPSAGWTVLRLDNEADPDYTQHTIISVNGYWSEFAGANPPLYQVEQNGGRSVWTSAEFESASLGGGTYRLINLTQGAQMQINASSFVGASVTETVNAVFAFADSTCHVAFNRCNFRYVDKTSANMSFTNCAYASDGTVAVAPVAAAMFGTTQSAEMFRWRGGYLESDGGVPYLVAGTTTPSTDATYARKFLLIPAGDALEFSFYCRRRGFAVGDQYNIVVFCKLPTFTGGSFTIQPAENGVSLSGGNSYTTASSGAVVRLNINRRLVAAAGDIGVCFGSSATGVAGNLEVYAIGIYAGNDSPRLEYPSHPANVITHAAAAPAAGGWTRGDVVWNTGAAAGGPPGWVCTATGTPGTWKAMANVAA